MLEEFKVALCNLSLKDGDIVFFDAGTIDPEVILEMDWDEMPDVTFLAVTRRPGESIRDALHVLPQSEAIELLESLKRSVPAVTPRNSQGEIP